MQYIIDSIYRQASRQAGRQASRQAGRQAGRQASRQAGRQADGMQGTHKTQADIQTLNRVLCSSPQYGAAR